MSPRRMRFDVHPLACVDCEVDTLDIDGQHEHYMVHDAVWNAAGMNKFPRPARPDDIRICDEGEPQLFCMTPVGLIHEYLCIGCLERRLGRRLTSADFTDAPINQPSPANTPRLASRLASKPVEGNPQTKISTSS